MPGSFAGHPESHTVDTEPGCTKGSVPGNPTENAVPRAAEDTCRVWASGAPDLYACIRTFFGVQEADIRTYSPLTLAYIGDCIYDLVIRSLVVARGNAPANQLHSHTSHLVKAHTQSEMLTVILPELTPGEESWYKRGRNAKSPTMAKNASVGDYRRATGFETLMGYLYMTDQTGRLLYLVNLGLAYVHSPEAVP